MIISEKNFQQIHTYLVSGGVSSRRLCDELADHLASLTEDIMRREGVLFEAAFVEARKQVCPQGPYSIQRDLFFSTLKQYVKMRKIQFIAGYLASALILVGYSFKVMHFPTAAIQIALGTLLLVGVFLPAYWHNRYKIDRLKGKGKPAWQYFINALILMTYAVGVLFLIMHWPAAKVLFVTGSVLLVFGFLPQYFLRLYQGNLEEAKA
ncbi:MAG: hypothetical protein AAF740_07410 [Bacteroidota bacterium]